MNKKELRLVFNASTGLQQCGRKVLLLALFAAFLGFSSTNNLQAQCDWTYYADSLTVVILGGIYDGRAKETGRWYRDASMEYVDAEGTKYIYATRDGVTYPKPMRITASGLVFYTPDDTLPTFRLCDTVGSLYRRTFSPISQIADSGARYMHYLGLQPYNALGKTRLCKVFLEYSVRYLDPITENDTAFPYDFYVWDIDSNGKPEVVIPIQYHILADSLGKVDEIDYHHQWVHRNTVIGIWFGSRFVGDPLVGVAGYNEAATSLTVRCGENNVHLSGIPEADVGTMATLELYDLCGRLRTTQRIMLINNFAISIPAGVVVSGDLCAWVLSQSNGTVSRGVLVVE